MPQRTARRLLIVGWDAADWQIIDPLLAAGRMPTLAGLLRQGVRSDLTTLEPKLSPLLWTSIATGRTPDLHGIANFVEPKPDGSGLRLSSSTTRKVKALWNIASQSGLSTQVTGWYASHPAEPIRGSVTSNLLMEGDPGTEGAWPVVAGAVHPPQLAEAIAAARVGRASARPTLLGKILPDLPPAMRGDSRIDSLFKLMAVAASVEQAALAAMRAGPWDLAMVFFETIDTVGHQFMQFRPPRMGHVKSADARAFGGVMDAVYRWHDEALGRLLAQAGPETTVILVSDHGFHSGAERPNLEDLPPERRMEREASWHRPIGVFVASGPGVRAGATPAAANIIDIAPTALALLGLPAAKDFGGRVLREVLEQEAPERIESWEAIEGDAGLHPPEVRQDPYEAADAIQQLVALGYMAALPKDAQSQVDLARRETAFNVGTHLMSRGRVRSALPYFETLVAARPTESRYLLGLATCLLHTGQGGRAAEVARDLLRSDAGHTEARLFLARALHAAGDEEGARREADAVSKALQKQPALRLNLGDLLLRQGRHEEALKVFRQAHEADRQAIQPLLGMARAHLCRSEWEKAAEAALEAMERTKAVPDGHMLLGAALAWAGEMDDAIRSLDLALRFDPAHSASLRMRAVFALAAGDKPGAAGFLARASDAANASEMIEPTPLPFEWRAFAAHLGVDVTKQQSG